MEVESMVDPELSGTNKKNVRYLFHYFSLGESEDDWIFLKDLNGCRESVEDYHRRLGWDPPDWTGNSKTTKKAEECAGEVVVAGSVEFCLSASKSRSSIDMVSLRAGPHTQCADTAQLARLFDGASSW
jgi:hypothetical protein